MIQGKDKQPADKPLLMGDCVMAGFPSPAEQYVEQALDLNELLVVLHPLAETRLNKMAEAMLVHLNEAKFTYPGTELQMVYEMLMPMSPSG